MKKTLSFEPLYNNYRGIVLIDKIVYLDKEYDTTQIHLVNGEILETHDSINTLEARINSEDNF